jgi:hypothetical protein
MLMSDQTDALTVARERIVHEAVEQTGALDLSGLDLTVLPEEVSRLKHLREFNCSSTQVSDLTLPRNGGHFLISSYWSWKGV